MTIVISEITTKREEDYVNTIIIGKTPTSRFDVRLGTDSYARCGYGFAKITMGQIIEIVDLIPRYEAEELHVRVLRAALGEVSENKAFATIKLKPKNERKYNYGRFKILNIWSSNQIPPQID